MLDVLIHSGVMQTAQEASWRRSDSHQNHQNTALLADLDLFG